MSEGFSILLFWLMGQNVFNTIQFQNCSFQNYSEIESSLNQFQQKLVITNGHKSRIYWSHEGVALVTNNHFINTLHYIKLVQNLNKFSGMTSSNCFVFSIQQSATCDIQFANKQTKNKEKQQILPFEKLEPAHYV